MGWKSKVLRDRVSKLGPASVRISAGLEISTVLPEMVEGDRVLTGARYGMIATLDDSRLNFQPV